MEKKLKLFREVPKYLKFLEILSPINLSKNIQAVQSNKKNINTIT